MKKILLLILLALAISIPANAKTFQFGSQTIEGELVYSSDQYIVIKHYDANGNPLLSLVVGIATNALPTVAKEICLVAVGSDNSEICDKIAAGVDFLTTCVNLGSQVFSFADTVTELFAEKGAFRSFIKFTTGAMNLFTSALSTFEAYDKLNIVKWDRITSNSQSAFNNLPKPVKRYNGEVAIKNVTTQDVVITVSTDGEKWTELLIPHGKGITYSLWQQRSNNQNYGFIKYENGCNYQIFTNREYQIGFDKKQKIICINEK
ncbi:MULTISPECIES: hypothetical protein [unclassified Flavobacterium]|uniref:hypothetical protein n=1 Tax=unclassified Flavobacterium TaxID=196869 RepID=UPI001F140569|nr:MULTISPECIES: hypothetical protein [unclassified Flavobacterium]UMY64897.1 hypothetical protein MKO97_10270 [Flavobacterium sp. HJ-32-4]